MKRYFDIKTIKFLVVGVINTIVGTGVMFISYNIFSASYWLSSALNYIIGSIVSYFLNKYFTFEYKKKNRIVMVKFVVNISICYLLAYGVAQKVIFFLLSGYPIRIKDNISMLAGMVLFVLINYFGQRLWVFKE